jgi:hypothetical protein
MDIAEFITTRLTDLERLAHDAEGSGDGAWESVVGAMGPEVRVEDGVVWARETPWDVWGCDDYSDEEGCVDARAGWMRQAEHIAAHDPAHVLADIASKRAIVEDYVTTCRIRDEAAGRIQEASTCIRPDRSCGLRRVGACGPGGVPA